MSKLETTDPGKNTSIRANLLLVNASYQRPRREDLIKKICDDFDWAKFNRPIINFRDNAFWIIDGQQRIAAVVMMDPICLIPVVLHSYNTIEKEAELFLSCNWNRKGMTAFDHWMALRAGNDPLVLNIDKTLTAFDLKLSRGNDTARTINSVQQLYHNALSDLEATKLVLSIIGRMMHLNSFVPAPVLGGLFHLELWLKKCGRTLLDERTREMTFADYFAAQPMTLLKNAALTYASVHSGSSLARRAMIGLIELGNKGLRNQAKRIPSPIEQGDKQ